MCGPPEGGNASAVFEAYGWSDDLSGEEILERLVALNHERAEEEKHGLIRWFRPDFQNLGGDEIIESVTPNGDGGIGWGRQSRNL